MISEFLGVRRFCRRAKQDHSFRDSIRYLHPTEPSPRGTMFLVVCEVVTGHQYATSKELLGSTAPPSGLVLYSNT